MKERPDLNRLAKEIFEANKIKGFHDKDTSNETLLMLVITELSEAVDADRKGRRFSLEEYELQTMTECQGWLTKEEKFKNVFQRVVKDTVEDELADAAIRLLDLAGLRELHIPEINHVGCDFVLYKFPENIFSLIELVINYKDIDLSKRIVSIIGYIEELCEFLSIDLWLHVELKLEYNKTRPHKHGKTY